MNKLLLLMPELFWGGAEQQFRYLISELGENVVVCIAHSYRKQSAYSLEERDFFNKNVKSVFINSNVASENKIICILRFEKIIKQVVRQYGVKCALIYDSFSCYAIPYLRMLGVQVIYSERNTGKGVIESRLKHFVRFVNYFTANSERAAKILQGYFHAPVKCIHNGINCTNTYHPRTTECNIMLIPARIAPVKNQRLILEFMYRHPEFRGDVKFAGKNEDLAYENELHQVVKRYGLEHRASFLGFQENMDALYKTNCFVVLPSFHEGMSNVILECFARGIPVFVSNIPENTFTEYLREFSFNPDDTEGLAKCIEKWNKLTVPEREVILDENYGYVYEEHSIPKMVNEYKRFLI